MTRATINNALRGLALPVVCVVVAACATGPGPDAAANAAAKQTSAVTAATEPASVVKDKAIAAYRDHLARYPDSPERHDISRRLADLLLEQAAEKRLEMAAAPGDTSRLEAESLRAYAEAVNHYESLLQRNPDGPDSSDLLYQLSRAYEESGQSQQALTAIDRLLAQSPDANKLLYADTLFRQGELLFGEGDYLAAGRSYQAVVDLGAEVPLYEQSLYKLGWSLFKQERYADALTPLFAFLEQSLTPTEPYTTQLPGLSAAEREQVAEIFRVISRSFAQLGGVDSVDQYFKRNGRRSYEEQVYLELADWYVEQEQVSEAASSWLLLAQRKPLGKEAPRLTARAISLYRQTGFRQRTLETQMRFVQTYGMSSEFWTLHSPADFPQAVQLLQSSLQELSRSSHERARRTGNEDDERTAELYYREYLLFFGDEAAAAEMNFQLAELLYENGWYRQSLDEYERAAWSHGAHPLAADAAMGAQHACNKILQQGDTAQKAIIEQRAMTGAVRFVQYYPEHPAAPALLVQSGTILLEQQHYDRALQLSEYLVAEATGASQELGQVAWSLRAQVLFEQENFPAAAAAYRQALQLAPDNDARRPALQEGLAIATYRQAGRALVLGDTHNAVALFQQAAELAPDTSLRAKAAYDAAAALLAQEAWTQAIELLERLRRNYPDDPLQPEVTRKLAYAYKRSGDDSRAADEYLRLGQDQRQSETLQREALLRAADIYMQVGARQQAIDTREHYLERFPEPAPVAVGLMQQLVNLESGKGDTRRRQYWLEEIIRLDRITGSDRTVIPAAEAALELAQYRLTAYSRIQLVSPLEDNLARKIDAMKQALHAFEAAMDYGITPVTTAATYHIAGMYDELGRALLASERPGSLTEEELVEYDLLLAKQAAPFEQQAIDLYSANARRFDRDRQDPWVEKSVRQLDQLQGSR